MNFLSVFSKWRKGWKNRKAQYYKKLGNDYLAKEQWHLAEEAYAQVIRLLPDSIEGYTNMLYVLHQVCAFDKAKLYIEQAAQISHQDADYFYLQALIFKSLGLHDEMRASALKSIELRKDFFNAYQILGDYFLENNLQDDYMSLISSFRDRSNNEEQYAYLIDKILNEQNINTIMELKNKNDNHIYYFSLANFFGKIKKYDDAIFFYKKSIFLKEDHIPSINNLAAIYAEIKCFEDAVELYRRAIDLDAVDARLHFNLANTLMENHHIEDAIKSYRVSIELDQNQPDYYHNLAIAYKEALNIDSAISVCDALINSKKENEKTLYLKAGLCEALGDFLLAEQCYGEAIEKSHTYTEAYHALGYLHHRKGDLEKAFYFYNKAIEFDADFCMSLVNLGSLMQELGKLDEAAVYFQKAIKLDPHNVAALNNLSGILYDQGDYDLAREMLKKALTLEPHNLSVKSNQLFQESVDANYLSPEYLKKLIDYGESVSYWVDKHSHGKKISPYTYNNKQLKVGFVSNDFRKHPVGYFLEGVLENLQKMGLFLIAYSNNPMEDQLTQKLKKSFNQWCVISHQSDWEVVNHIRQNGINILIDLSGHTGGNRLSLFGYRAAPVQVSWLGYWASTGVKEMDYLLADEFSLPINQQRGYTEKIVYVPNTRLCFTPPNSQLAGEVAPLPAITRGFVTFGCFQNLNKINSDVLGVWAKVLEAVPSSRLRVQSKQLGDAAAKHSFIERLERASISLVRVDLLPKVDRADYFKAYSEVDFILDTFPFSGGTTTCEAIWMGVPTLTLLGETMIARQGAAMMKCVGLSDWIAATVDEYVACAVTKAAKLPELASLRKRLRENAMQSSLFDVDSFSINVEKTLINLYQKTLLSEIK